MEAIILAGGFGTRLQSIVTGVPKPMAPIRNVPFLTYIFEYLCNYGITKVVLSTGYMHEIIRNHYGSSYKDLTISYSNETKPLGTGGAIKQALEMIEGENSLILNGDSFFRIDLNGIIERHIDMAADVTIAVKAMYNFDRYGVISLEKNRVVDFQEKKWTSNGYISGGLYIGKTSIFNGVTLPESFSFETDYLQKYVSSCTFMAYESKEYFIDIGIPDDYRRAQEELYL
ncbi:nucleotidyltransferase family protein [Paenibacillus alba]|uniref:Nucleotidyltransferase family protein n=1 Tax=Paenibacillus alba TaxID=1197127 RepID=A0ABU6G1A3_9BACL|nr:nucleotidyltransferase family protein [Paenibacillus alba]MEC0227948.1 nucleotidyltransferase family protein [Paenibacillus alba]